MCFYHHLNASKWQPEAASTTLGEHPREMRCFFPPWEPLVSVVYQGLGSEVSWKCDGDPQPGEKVLQDIKERRGQERRLQEIHRQLELLGQSQEMTVSSKQLHAHEKTHAHAHPNTCIHTIWLCCVHYNAPQRSSVDTCVTNYYKHTAHSLSFLEWEDEITCNIRVSADP